LSVIIRFVKNNWHCYWLCKQIACSTWIRRTVLKVAYNEVVACLLQPIIFRFCQEIAYIFNVKCMERVQTDFHQFINFWNGGLSECASLSLTWQFSKHARPTFWHFSFHNCQERLFRAFSANKVVLRLQIECWRRHEPLRFGNNREGLFCKFCVRLYNERVTTISSLIQPFITTLFATTFFQSIRGV